MRRLILFPFRGLFGFAGLFVLMLATMAVAARAQAGEFEIAQNGTTVGTANFQFTATKDGYDSTSLVKVAMEGLDYSLSKDEQLTAANQLEHVILSATVNGEAVNVVAEPDAAQLLLNISASGKSSTTRLAAHAGAVFMADFDAGALETLLALAVKQNNRDMWAILPKEAGSVEPVRLATYPDQEGTLEGEPIAVHHLVATIAGAYTELFSGPDNQFLQAELPQAGFALIRKGFVLAPPAKPIVPIDGEGSTPAAPAN
ncbi:MAG TPA: hypothetical protein VIJ38_18140 [Acidobacteriaceae bacterium]